MDAVVITISIVAVVAHWPAVGVKVYVVVPTVAVLTVAGLHVPVMVLVDVVGKAGAVVFCTNGPTCAKAGVTGAVITTSIVVVEAPCPAVGVKVYVVVPTVAVLMVAGLHVPVKLFVDVVGRAGAVAF